MAFGAVAHAQQRGASAAVGGTITAVQIQGNVRAETGDVASNISDVAAATHELSASVGEISRQVSHAASIAKNAVTQAKETNAKQSKFADPSMVYMANLSLLR